jgi:ribosomal-protein-alanine N-acetyltransferase
MTTLTTARLSLRKPLKTDADALVQALNNLNVSRWTGRIPHPYGPTDAEAFFTHARDCPPGELVLFILREGGLIGGIGIEKGELGYWLAEPHWGQGYGREAARAVVDHAFLVEGRHVITACYFTENTASRRILEGLGFAETGKAVCFSRARQSDVAVIRLVLTRAAWQDARERQR